MTQRRFEPCTAWDSRIQPTVAAVIRGWHHGRIAATRTERGREAFTRWPRLLEAAQATGAAGCRHVAVLRLLFRAHSGVQIQSLFLAQPRLLELIVRVMAFAPRFARTLSRHPAALDALLDPGFFGPIHPRDDLAETIAGADDFERAMDIARRAHREDTFRIGVQVLAGAAAAAAAGPGFADLADSVIAGLARAALRDIERTAGEFSGDCAVIALGKCGSREMTMRSDLDLDRLYTVLRGRTRRPLSAGSARRHFTRALRKDWWRRFPPLLQKAASMTSI